MIANNEILNLICRTFNVQSGAELVGKISATAGHGKPQHGKAANPGQKGMLINHKTQ
jgi:hypothetical protein